MFNKLNYSYKFFYFTLLLVLVFFTVYKVAISDSVKLYSENERLKKELSKIEQTDSLIKVLERQQNNLKRYRAWAKMATDRSGGSARHPP